MLQPRESDIPVLFMVLVVLPLFVYILLGKWSEATKKQERVSLLAELAAEEAFGAQTIRPTTVAIPIISTPKNGIYACARCSSPATTRCSRCKSVRYCSGKCQIIHWRQVHKQECQRLETTSSCSSPSTTSIQDSFSERASINDGLNSFDSGYYFKDNAPSDKISHPSTNNGVSTATGSEIDTSQGATLQKRSSDKSVHRKSYREMLRQDVALHTDSLEETSVTMCGKSFSSNNASNVHVNGQNNACAINAIHNLHSGKTFESRSKHGSLSASAGKNGRKVHETEPKFNFNGGDMPSAENNFNNETVELNCSYESPVMKESETAKGSSQSKGTKISRSSKSTRTSGEQSHLRIEGRRQITDDSKVARMGHSVPAPGSNGVAGTAITKIMGSRKSTKLTGQDAVKLSGIQRKVMMLFPYEEFVQIFNCEVFNLSPRGLLNCGNSCYANAVLQCLTCTKPLIIFLLRRSHSRACCGRDRCLMCELEKHVMMLRDCGGPLSPSTILLHIQNNNSQIGDGSQEDAHEFLRLLVACMQSTCLQGLGGEDKINPLLQETTFIQHTFGGRLRSKVKCLRCHHESERYESIMDLTLEIFGRVDSLEDALTQFTTPEELDGENKYRCGRCATYVRARKQLSIHEAPNILTIVLKRFQEGKYGKINKYITFPDMLDMIPFMTGTGDIPALYMLYAVVVHLDTLNASFSGHYVAYVKDLQGNWFRVDDTEVRPVPMSQVMSEEAYILFYIRSCPRPEREFYEKAVQQQFSASAVHCISSRTQKPSRKGHSKSSSHPFGPEPLLDLKPQNGTSNINRNVAQVMEFSDATSSDWSLFTSSDESSFTTESTRDSFSTVDYTDACNADTFSSIFDNLYTPQTSRNAVCRRTFSNRAHTRFISEERGYVLDSYLSMQQPKYEGESFKEVGDYFMENPSDSCCNMSLKYGTNPKYSHDRTSGYCKF